MRLVFNSMSCKPCRTPFTECPGELEGLLNVDWSDITVREVLSPQFFWTLEEDVVSNICLLKSRVRRDS